MQNTYILNYSSVYEGCLVPAAAQLPDTQQPHEPVFPLAQSDHHLITSYDESTTSSGFTTTNWNCQKIYRSEK